MVPKPVPYPTPKKPTGPKPVTPKPKPKPKPTPAKTVNVKDSRTIGQLLLQSALSRPMTLKQITQLANQQVAADRKSALTALGTEQSVSQPFVQAGQNQTGITNSLLDRIKQQSGYTARLAAPTVAAQMGALDASGRATGVAVGAMGSSMGDVVGQANAAAVPILQESAFNANAQGGASDAIAARAAYDARQLGSQQATALDKWRQMRTATMEQSNASRLKLIQQMQGEAFQQRMGNANLLMGLYNTASGQEDLGKKLGVTMRGQDVAANTAAADRQALNDRTYAQLEQDWKKQGRELALGWWKAKHPTQSGVSASGLPTAALGYIDKIGSYVAAAHKGNEKKVDTGRTIVKVSVNNGSGASVERQEVVPREIAGKPQAITEYLAQTKPNMYNAGVQFTITDARFGPALSKSIMSRRRADVAAGAYAQFAGTLGYYGVDPKTVRLWIKTAMDDPRYQWQ